MMNVKAKLSALRARMRRHRLDAYLVPSGDPHQSEYVPAAWERRKWLSGFTGSAGDLLVTPRSGGLWTDGRYFLQAQAELGGSGIRLHRTGQPGVLGLIRHVAEKLPAGAVLGVDPRVISLARARELEAALRERKGRLRLLLPNLVDEIWADRPAPSARPISVRPRKLAGETTASKLARVRAALRARGAAAHLLTGLDNIAWLFNIRGGDVAYNPVAVAYALVTRRRATLFIDPVKVPAGLRRRLAPQVTVRPYDAVAGRLRALAAAGAAVWIDPERVNRWAAGLLAGAAIRLEPGPVPAMQARKNARELEGMRRAHVRDGVAMARFLHWLEGAVPAGGVTEMSAAARLEEFRAAGDHFRGLSFPTISGYAAHGAIIHYAVDEASDRRLRPRGIYLVDSGAQYLDGTTDITRTLALGGVPSRRQREHFTRVLKGHIALARARFPAGTRGQQLDTLARGPLWEGGLDYAHGTGHGVGAYLNVHEGPQSINPSRTTDVPLEAGNIQSNEPGYYAAGAYGIRIENLMEVVVDAKLSGNGRTFYRFETLSLCPIDRRLIDGQMLSDAERGWLDRYHRRVARTLGPRLGRATARWLRAACAPI